jgi:hypothetical protein
MQLWLLAGYICLVLAAVLSWVMSQIGSSQAAIVIGVSGAVLDIALIARGVWSYIKVMQIRARGRADKPTGFLNNEWLVAWAFLLIPLGLYTFWYFKLR